MSLLVLVPEAVVAVGGAGLWLAGRHLAAGRLRWAAMGVALVAFALELWLGSAVGTLFGGGWAQDRFALFAKAALLFATFVLVLAEERWARRAPLPLAFAVCLGGMIAASATTLLGLWLGLAVALSAGVAAAVLAAPEAGSRLWPLGLSAGGLVTVGFGLTWALTRTFTAAGLQALAPAQVSAPAAIVVLVGLAGIATAITLGPLGAVAVDGSLEGAAGGTGGLLMGAAVVVGIQYVAWLWPAAGSWSLWMAVLASFALLAGPLRALATPTPRSAAAWLVVGQLGWVAAALAVNDRAGQAAALFGLGGLLLAACAVPALTRLERERLRGLAASQPALGVGLGLVLLSLAGLPPLAGFYGQFMVAGALVHGSLIWALTAGLLGWLVAVAAVVRLLRPVFLEAPEDVPRRSRRRWSEQWSMEPLLVGGLVLAYGLFAYPIQVLAAQAAAALRLP
jgi:NADH-quinone oxidoreductase subunit N